MTLRISSCDRTGGNDDGANGTYSCPRRAAAGCLIADRSGPGQIESIWFARDFGNLTATGDITVRIDGRKVIDGPLVDVLNGALGPPSVPLLLALALMRRAGRVRRSGPPRPAFRSHCVVARAELSRAARQDVLDDLAALAELARSGGAQLERFGAAARGRASSPAAACRSADRRGAARAPLSP